MPDPVVYLLAVSASLAAGVICGLVANRCLARSRSSYSRIVSLFGIGLSVFLGYLLLRFQFAWPPAKALDRFLVVILPATFIVEIAAGNPRVHPELVRFLRLVLMATTARILVHDSVYVHSDGNEWSALQLAFLLIVSSVLLAAVWMSMLSLLQCTSDISVPITLAMTILAAGLVVMLAGYLKGGAASFPIASALFGVAVVCRNRADVQGMIGIGVMSLFSVLFIGRFFGGVTTTTAVVVFVSPLMCWIVELPGFRPRKPWQVVALRLGLVAIPLLIVLAIAKRDFDRGLGPLATVKQLDVVGTKS